MDEEFSERDLWRAWWGILVAGIVLIVAGAIALPRTVYDGFIWQYFWGPVVADGEGVACAERIDGETVLHATTQACGGATGVVAEPGYTVISTVSYGLVLLFALVSVYLAFERTSLVADAPLFFALVPFMFLGGTARVLEDATLAAGDNGAFVLDFPATAILISPFIYFFVFGLAIAALAVGVMAANREMIDRYEYGVVGIGTALLVLSLVYLVYLVSLADTTISIPMLLITLGGATVVTAAVWFGIERHVPSVNEATGTMGAVIIWGHAVDGFANVLSLDWGPELGLGRDYGPKHVVNDLVITITGSIQPEWLNEAIGEAWPFILLKVAVAAVVVGLFNDELVDDSPRFSLLLLIAILAVGLGPGTRDLLRATFGV